MDPTAPEKHRTGIARLLCSICGHDFGAGVTTQQGLVQAAQQLAIHIAKCNGRYACWTRGVPALCISLGGVACDACANSPVLDPPPHRPHHVARLMEDQGYIQTAKDVPHRTTGCAALSHLVAAFGLCMWGLW